MPGEFLVPSSRESVLVILQLEVRGSSQYSTMHRTVLDNKDSSSLNAQSSKTEKPGCTGFLQDLQWMHEHKEGFWGPGMVMSFKIVNHNVRYFIWSFLATESCTWIGSQGDCTGHSTPLLTLSTLINRVVMWGQCSRTEISWPHWIVCSLAGYKGYGMESCSLGCSVCTFSFLL